MLRVVVAPAGAPRRTLAELKAAEPARFAVAAGGVEAFFGDQRVATYLAAGRYVIAEFVDVADALELERRLREGALPGAAR